MLDKEVYTNMVQTLAINHMYMQLLKIWVAKNQITATTKKRWTLPMILVCENIRPSGLRDAWMLISDQKQHRGKSVGDFKWEKDPEVSGVDETGLTTVVQRRTQNNSKNGIIMFYHNPRNCIHWFFGTEFSSEYCRRTIERKISNCLLFCKTTFFLADRFEFVDLPYSQNLALFHHYYFLSKIFWRWMIFDKQKGHVRCWVVCRLRKTILSMAENYFINALPKWFRC